MSRFSQYRDLFLLLLPFSVPILTVSRLISLIHLIFCPDSRSIETYFSDPTHFLSRFSQYRDSLLCSIPLFVPILTVSRLIPSPSPFFCPDSHSIETYFSAPTHFLSRFSQYRDSLLCSIPFSVPILAVSRLISLLHPFICPNSCSIETYFSDPTLFLSRFTQYRDSFPLSIPFSVPILTVSRLTSLLHPFFCPNSHSIETHFSALSLFLSRFSQYRDSFLFSIPFSVPIPALSRLISSPSPFFCPDSRTIETHFFSFSLLLSRFPQYRDSSFLSIPSHVSIRPLSKHLSLISPSSPTPLKS